MYHFTRVLFWIMLTWFAALFSEKHNAEHKDGRLKQLADQPVQSDGTAEKSERCCAENGICSHEVLRNGEPDCDTNVLPRKMMRKVGAFSLCLVK